MFCPAGSSSPIPCPSGMYCNHYMLSKPSGYCSSGYYCPGGNRSPTPPHQSCPMGHYCPEASSFPSPCLIGFYLNTTKNFHIEKCLPCIPGYACTMNGLAFPTLSCNAGYYCPLGTNVTSPEQFICPFGHFCPQGSPWPIGCQSGTYQNSVGKDECIVCPEGYYCDALLLSLMTGIPGHGVVTPQICPPGSYCRNGTQFSLQYLCPTGTFSNITGLLDEAQCISCTPGNVCSTVGLIEPDSQCSAGFFCSRGA